MGGISPQVKEKRKRKITLGEIIFRQEKAPQEWRGWEAAAVFTDSER
jgi:hypothetical protein